MKPPVRFLDEDAVVLRAHVSAHGAEERLHGGPVDVLRPKSERRAQSWPRDIIEAQCRGLGCFVEELAQHTVALQSPLGRPRPAGPARALCLFASLRCFGLRGSQAQTFPLAPGFEAFLLRPSARRASFFFLLSLLTLPSTRRRLPQRPVALELGYLAARLGDEFFVHAQFVECFCHLVLFILRLRLR